MAHNNKELTLNAMSVEPVDAPQKAAQAVKKAGVELVKAKEKGKLKKVKRKVLETPPEDAWCIIIRDGVRRAVRAHTLDFVGNDVFSKMRGDKLTEKYLGWCDTKNPIRVVKPQDIMEYPFWAEDMGDELIVNLKKYHSDFGITYFRTDTADININWIDAKTLGRVTEVEIEVDDKGEEVLPEIAVQISNMMKKHAGTATGLSFSLYAADKETGAVWGEQRNNAACHYNMRCFLNDGQRKRLEVKCAGQFITDKYYRHTDTVSNEEVDRYVTWVMNESPWARYILTKDLETAKEKGIIVRTDIPSNAMMCTFYALRYPTEFPAVIKRWADYTKAGLDGSIAFYKAETQGYRKNVCSHHGLLDTFSMDIERLVAFINNEEGKVKEDRYDKQHNYANVSIHHGLKYRPNTNALEKLQKDFPPTKVKEKHPVLGEIEKDVAADARIDEYLTAQLKGKK